MNNEPGAVLTLEDNVFPTSGVAVEAVNGVRVCINGSTIDQSQCNPSRGSSMIVKSPGYEDQEGAESRYMRTGVVTPCTS